MRKDIKNILSGLSRADQALLLEELMARNGLKAQHLQNAYPGELLRIERWLLNSADKAVAPKTRSSRLRLWFIFMLLRYGGLRLEEIFDLEAEDLELSSARLYIKKGRHKREVPLPPIMAAQMRDKLEKWPALVSLSNPFKCDGSMVRRAFSQCAERCGISPGLFNARALRRHRRLELENAGLSPSLVNLFLGRFIPDLNFNPDQGRKILRQTITNEQFPKTSARNAFYGRITHLVETGILVEIALETAGGLQVNAIITATSRQNLGLEIGMPVTALVKAPWVNIFNLEDAELLGRPNHFCGKIKEIKQDENAMEIKVALPQGNLICALYIRDNKPEMHLSAGESLGVEFSPFAVILTPG